MQVRFATAEDAEWLALLAGELGYPATAEALARRLGALDGDHAVWVAAGETSVPIAWLHAGVRRALQSEPYVEVLGLVVSEAARGGGVGAMLLEHAEAWAKSRGYSRIGLRSNVTRERAHRFYLREGYAITKTSALFVKEL